MTTAIELHAFLLDLREGRPCRRSLRRPSIEARARSADGEIEATTLVYVWAAVTEIATFRSELSGPQFG